MGTEHVRIAQLSYILTRLGVRPRRIVCVKTDAFILQLPAKQLAAVKAIATLRLEQLHTLRRDRAGRHRPTLPQQRRRNDAAHFK